MASYDQAARILKQSAVENTVTVMVQYNPDSKFLLYNIASFRGLLLLPPPDVNIDIQKLSPKDVLKNYGKLPGS